MNILSPDPHFLSKPQSEDVTKAISYCGKSLERLFNIGTRILAWEDKDSGVDPFEATVVITMFRRYLELLDAARILVENSSIVPCYGMLRILLELFFEFDYLLKDKTKISKNVQCYLLMELDSQLASAEFNLNDPHMIDLLNKLPSALKAQEINHLQNIIADCTAKIAQPSFDAIRPVYLQKVFSGSGGTRNTNVTKWYTLTGKISGTRWLTENLNQKRLHYYVYGEASNVIHSSSLFSDTIIPVGTKVHIRLIRDISKMEALVPALIKATLEMYDVMASRRTKRQQEEYRLAIMEFRSTYKDVQPKYVP